MTAINIFADIIADFQNFDSTTVGPIGNITASNGDFEGLIQGTHITGSGIRIDGDLIGEMRLGNMFGQGSAVPFNINSPPILIGGSLPLGSIIKLPEAGTAGPLILNGNNAGGTWDGIVQIGAGATPLQLSDPNYTNLPSELGGGSIGMAPYALHDEASTPVNGFVWPETGIAPITEVRLRHYGTAKRIPGTTPVVIQRRFSKCGVITFGPDIASQFVNIISSSDNTLVLQGDFEYGYEYKISPTNDLLSGNVAGEPPVSWAGNYTIDLNNPICPADNDGTGTVDVEDLLVLLGAWGVCSECTADSDCNSVVDVEDLLILLGAWGICPAMGQPAATSTVQSPDLLVHESKSGAVSDTWDDFRGASRERWAADEFQPLSPGPGINTVNVSSVRWWGFYEDQGADCQIGYTDGFTITYYDTTAHPFSGNQVPNNVIATFQVTPSAFDPNQTLSNGIPLTLYSAMHAPVQVSVGQCYWIEIKNNGGDTTGSSGCHWRWAWSGDGTSQYSAKKPESASSYLNASDPDHSQNLSFSLDIEFEQIIPAFACIEF